MDTPKTVSRSAFAFLSGTLLSRVSGLGRDMAMAFCFGSHPATAAFMVAFRFANLLRRLVGEGPLASGFIPYFEKLRGESAEKGAYFFRDLLFSLSFFLILLILGLEIGLYCFWRFGDFFPETLEILYLTLLMFPGLLFISLFGIGSGFLQCEKKFFLSGFAPTLFNVVWIVTLFLFRHHPPMRAMMDLSLAVVLGFAMQWAMLVPEMIRFFKKSLPSWKLFFCYQIFSVDVRSMLKPLLFSMVGVGAVQVNAALDALFARYASLEGPAYLWYAIRIQQLPLALFGIALSSALLPSLSRMIQDGSHDKFFHLIRFALRRAFAFIFPCTLGIFVLGALSINLIYGRGDFSNEATLQTYLCLCGYAVGLLPSVFVLLVAPCCYAQRDYKTPMVASIGSVIFNALLSVFFVVVLGLGAASLALATSLAAFVNYQLLSFYFVKQMGPLWDAALLWDCIKSGLATVLASLVTLLGGAFFGSDPTFSLWQQQEVYFPREFRVQLFSFMMSAGVFFCSLLIFAWILKARSLLECVGFSGQEERSVS